MNFNSPLAFFLLSLLVLPVAAQDWARERVEQSPRHLEWVELDADGRKLSTYVAYPEVADKATAIVVIHEIYGHSDWIRLMTDHLAEAGYVVVSPDLLSGMGPDGGGTDSFESVEKARKGVSTLPPEQITSDLKAAVNYARNIPAANGKVIVAGFCWGGTQSFRFATNSDDIEAALVFYGTAPEDRADLKRIEIPVYGFYAENDARVNATLVETAKAMKELGKKFDMEVYLDAGHGFMRAGEAPDASEGNERARARAWERVTAILGRLQ